MILKIKTPGAGEKDFTFYSGIKSIETSYGLFGSWKYSDFDHWVTGDGNRSIDELCVLVIHAIFKDGHCESFIISTYVYIMNDEGKTVEKLFSI